MIQDIGITKDFFSNNTLAQDIQKETKITSI